MYFKHNGHYLIKGYSLPLYSRCKKCKERRRFQEVHNFHPGQKYYGGELILSVMCPQCRNRDDKIRKIRISAYNKFKSKNRSIIKEIKIKFPACFKCGSTRKVGFDHILPQSQDGPNSLYNLQRLCLSCNAAKNNRIRDHRPFEYISFIRQIKRLDKHISI